MLFRSPVMANSATNIPLATSVSAAAADLTLTPSGSFTATASRPPHSLQSKQHGCSLKTIRRHLAKAVTKAPGVTPQAAVNLIVDTTYFGRKWGVMVLYDAISKRALSVLEVKSETIERYRQEVAALQERGVVIQSIICDGRSGLLQAFPGIPVQMCQFHQIKIIVRYLTSLDRKSVV